MFSKNWESSNTSLPLKVMEISIQIIRIKNDYIWKMAMAGGRIVGAMEDNLFFDTIV